MKKRKSISVWIEEKTWCGQFTFSHDDLITAFPEMSAGAIARALTREVANGRIVSPVRGFYVVVPEEYRLRGTVHQSFYIDNLNLSGSSNCHLCALIKRGRTGLNLHINAYSYSLYFSYYFPITGFPHIPFSLLSLVEDDI